MNPLILVVDDEKDAETLFRQHFRKDLRAGRFVMAFADGAQAALDIIDAADSATLILILSDINMPGMSGLDLLVRARSLRPDVPVVMVSAYGDADTRARAIAGGAEGFLTKPVDFAFLRSEIARRLENGA